MGRPTSGDASDADTARTLLQQQLISVSARLDHQLEQLRRLNELSNRLLTMGDLRAIPEMFAEGIADILEVNLAVVWVLPPWMGVVDASMGVCGWRGDDAQLAQLAQQLLDRVAESGVSELDPDWLQKTLGIGLQQAAACRCRSRTGVTSALILAASTNTVDNALLVAADERRTMFAVLAEKCAAHLDNSLDRHVVATQLEQLRASEEQLHFFAFHDPLTSLANRRLLSDRLQQALRRAERSGERFAVLVLDLDRLKQLNDTHGHAAGDQMLAAVAARLTRLVRPHDTVARLGGDEFVIVLEDLGTSGADAMDLAMRIAEDVLRQMREPYVIDIGTTHHTVSIGLVLSSDTTVPPESLIQAADLALYEAKQKGRNLVQPFDPVMHTRAERRAVLEARLRAAFTRSELQLFYQAQVDESGALFGAEALARWYASDLGVVGPDEFISVAEASGFIHTLGQWGIETACRQATAWADVAPNGFRVAVNLSPAEFLHPELANRVADALGRTGADPHRLRLEITEQTVLSDTVATVRRMQDLSALGVEFSLDDFGAGRSSIAHLHELPVQEVKIDRAYIASMLNSQKDYAIVRSVIDLAGTLGMRVVAEGVESAAHLDALRQAGCRHFQGYLFGKAIAPPAHPDNLAANGCLVDLRRRASQLESGRAG